jgi:uncharacterized tellurite resistance protein B-like protein
VNAAIPREKDMAPPLKIQRQLAFLKILAGLAWADGELSVSEVNRIKHFLRRFDIPDEHWAEVEMVLLERMTMEECLAQVELFLGLSAGSGERALLAEALEELAVADGSVSSEEREFVDRALHALDSSSSARGFLSSLQGLLRGLAAPGSTRGETEEEISLFSRNRLLYRVRRRLTRRNQPPDEKEALLLEQGSLAGGILGLVLEERGDWAPAAVDLFRHLLADLTGLHGTALDVLVEVVCEEGRQSGLDQSRLTSEYRLQSNSETRIGLVEAMFSLAGADGESAPHDLAERIRRVADGLGVSHDDFIRARLGKR